jgi:hypothetical protein
MSVIVKRSQRQTDKAQDVPRCEGAAAALAGFQLDRAPFDHNQRIPPIGLLVRDDATRWDRDEAELERRWDRPAQK